MDFTLQNAGSILILRPVSPGALAWVKDNIGSDNGYQPYWPAVTIEARYAHAIITGILEDGLEVEGF